MAQRAHIVALWDLFAWVWDSLLMFCPHIDEEQQWHCGKCKETKTTSHLKTTHKKGAWNPRPFQFPTLPNRKHLWPLGCMLHLLIGEAEISFPRLVCHHFSPKLMAKTYKIHLTYSPLLFMRWGASQVWIFFGNEPIWLAHYSKKMKLWRLPKIEVSILKHRVPPQRPTYIGKRRTTFARGAIGNSLRNMSGTWELFTLTTPTPKNKTKKRLAWKVDCWFF